MRSLTGEDRKKEPTVVPSSWSSLFLFYAHTIFLIRPMKSSLTLNPNNSPKPMILFQAQPSPKLQKQILNNKHQNKLHQNKLQHQNKLHSPSLNNPLDTPQITKQKQKIIFVKMSPSRLFKNRRKAKMKNKALRLNKTKNKMDKLIK